MPRLLTRILSAVLLFGALTDALAQINNGPFAGVAIKHAEPLLLWSQSATQGSSSRSPYFKMYDFTYAKTGADTNLHPTFVGKPKQNVAGTNGLSTNRHVAVAAGNFMGTGHDRYVAAWQSAAGKVNVFMPDINETTLQANPAAVPSELDNLTLKTGTSEYLRSIQLATGNFTGADHDQFVLAYVANADSKIHLRTYDTGGAGSLTPVNTADIGDEGIVAASSIKQQFAIATGDFNKDGKSEIVLAGVDFAAYSGAGGLFVKIYQANAAGTALTARVRTLIRPLPSIYYQVNVAVATGDLDGDGADDIALAYTFFADDGNQNTIDSSYMVMLKPSTALDNITVASKNFVTLPTSSLGGHTIAVAAGRIYSDTAAVVVGTANGYDIFYSTDGSMKPLPIGRLSNNSVSPGGPDAYAGNASIAIGYVQTTYNNTRASIVVAEDQQTISGLYSAFRVTTYTADPTDPKNRRWDANTWASYLSDSVSYGGSADIRGFALAVGDFDKRIQRLGAPRYQKPTVVHPTFVVNAPPTHYDIIGNTVYDLNSVFSSPGAPPVFVSTYDTQNQQDSVGGTTVSSGYDVSAELSASKDFGVVSINASISASYAHNTTTDLSKSYSQTYKSGTKASTEDWLYAMQTGYNFWEYPVFKGDTLKGYVSVASPIAPTSVFQSLKGAAFDYEARHEVGNLLSYMDHTTLLANPQIQRLFFTGAVQQEITASSSGTGSLDWGVVTDQSKTDSSGLSVGASVGGGGFGIELKASGNYGSSRIQTVKTTVSSSTSMGYTFGSQNRQDANYFITPLWYWARNGALVLDYAVDLDLTNPSGFWKTNYGHAVDPGFILPHKFDTQKGDTTSFAQSVRLKTPSITFFPAQAGIGDTVTLLARINNFSLVDIAPGKIHVRFYNEDPSAGGSILSGIAGDTSASTVFIPARGQDVAKLTWKVAVLPHGRLFAKITADTAEIRVDNNVAWNYFASLDNAVLSVEPKPELPGLFALDQNYPNPFNPSTMIRYSLPHRTAVSLVIYNTLGQQVATLVQEEQGSGMHEVRFDARTVASGVYFYRLKAGEFSSTRKMMLLK